MGHAADAAPILRSAVMADVDLDAVGRARDGDRDAFDRVAMQVVDRLYRVARLILRDGDRAEDAVQAALVRCWRDLPSLRDVARFDAWLRQLLLRSIQDELRSTGRQRAIVTLLRPEGAGRDTTEAVAVQEQLDRGFQRLTVEHRAVLVLRLYLGLSLEETAATLGIPAGTAKSRLHYATAAMRDALEADARSPIREVSA
jgi:RNA polymerase sigma-70 factor (ECF subfamily)